MRTDSNTDPSHRPADLRLGVALAHSAVFPPDEPWGQLSAPRVYRLDVGPGRDARRFMISEDKLRVDRAIPAQLHSLDPAALPPPRGEETVGILVLAELPAPGLRRGETTRIQRLVLGALSSGWRIEVSVTDPHDWPSCRTYGPNEPVPRYDAWLRALADLLAKANRGRSTAPPTQRP